MFGSPIVVPHGVNCDGFAFFFKKESLLRGASATGGAFSDLLVLLCTNLRGQRKLLESLSILSTIGQRKLLLGKRSITDAV